MATKEAQVIGAVLKNKDIHTILGQPTELFGAYGDVSEMLKGYYGKFRTVPDISIVLEKFPDISIPEDTNADTAYYLDELKNQYVNARLETIMVKAAKAKGILPPAKILENMQTALAKLGQFTAGSRDLSLMDYDAAEGYFEKLHERTELNGGVPGIKTGFDAIDSCYPTGLAPGNSVILMGYTGRGKSFFAGILAVNAWLQGYKVMVISLEMSPEEYRERIYATMSKGMFKINDMARGDVDKDNFRTWAKKNLENKSDFIVVSNEGNANVTPNFVRSKIEMHKPDLVILDYLQLMSDNAQTTAMTPRMLNLSREIKLTAVDAAVPIISITAVTDEDNDKRDAPPVLSQVAWSKGIEYDASLAIAVHRYDDTDRVEIVGRKNRHGSLFDVFFEVDFNSGLWVESFM